MDLFHRKITRVHCHWLFMKNSMESSLCPAQPNVFNLGCTFWCTRMWLYLICRCPKTKPSRWHQHCSPWNLDPVTLDDLTRIMVLLINILSVCLNTASIGLVKFKIEEFTSRWPCLWHLLFTGTHFYIY